ncbi:probable L-type lectin-domain containing receptor kinase S.5 [Salvia hispanica]|uniref:probable L-type lectin-domain containing receptor kinase S.5 n=1 Tax=Salvia hispanica TaxID=49212 RepID=UPI002009C925|nr:probable L-type lectin-domain containing receptor kinase S.5 [Salvia hispanica]
MVSSAAAAAAAVVVILLATVVAQGKKVKTFKTSYDKFDPVRDYDTLIQQGDASIHLDALQVTKDSANTAVVNISNLSGRILLNKRFRLWEDRARQPSFSTSFLVNIFPKDPGTEGGGLAFVIVPDHPAGLPARSTGGYLGFTNASTDSNSTANQLVAVELDTSKQGFDPDSNHIGLNLHSVRSVVAKPLTPHHITLASFTPRFYNVWVEYDGRRIQVYIAEQHGQNASTPLKPRDAIIERDLNLTEHVSQYSYFGFAASTGDMTQLNCIRRWNLTVQHFEKDPNWLVIGLGTGIGAAVVLALGAVGLVYYCRKRRAISNPNLVGALRSLPGTPQEFEFKDLKKATNSFDERNKLGQGGYGEVFRGNLAKENLDIAVKRFSRESLQGQDDFLAELTIINRLRHRHLVKLLGWCHKYGKLLLVYEYMPNGSLDKHLFVGPDVQPLGWHVRYKIVSGVASALQYLHNEYEQRVVHRDLKASNIMLDSNFNARLGDFGLARALDNEKTSYAEAEGVLGTMGYIAPECFHMGKATQQSDVYAFGAVVLELVCGRRPGAKIGGFQLLVDWVWYLHRDGRLLEAVDPRLGEDFVGPEAERLLLLGLACSHPIAAERPKTQAIVQIISGTVAAPVVPPFKPAFVWPAAAGPMGLDTGSATETTSHLGSEWSGQYLSRESYTGYTDSSLV